MKIKIHSLPPKGAVPTNELRIFSPMDDPSVCVMCQRFVKPIVLVSNEGLTPAPENLWVAIQTERVDKIIFV